VPKSCPFQTRSGQFQRTPAHDDATGSPLGGKGFRGTSALSAPGLKSSVHSGAPLITPAHSST